MWLIKNFGKRGGVSGGNQVQLNGATLALRRRQQGKAKAGLQ